MFAKKTDKTPLFVHVTPNRWDAIGSPTNPRHSRLFAMLKAIGGVNDSVPPGWYDFDLERKGLRLYATLKPHQEK